MDLYSADGTKLLPVAIVRPGIQVATSGSGANSSVSCTLPAVPGKTNYITGFDVTGSGATAGSVVTVTLNGCVGGTLSYTLAVVAGVLLPNQPLVIEFPEPLQATGPNVAINVTCPGLGAGNTNNTVNVYGYVA